MTRPLPSIRRSFALLLAGTCCAATLQSLHAQTPGASPSSAAKPGAAPAESASLPSNAAPVVPAPGSSPAAAASPEDAAKAVDVSSTTLTGAPVPKSQNVTINLINRLVQRGVLSKEDAADLIKQAEADAEDAKAQAEATQAATDQAAAAAQAAASAQAAVAQSNSNPLAPEFAPSGDDVRVTYIPEVVKAQLRDEIKGEVMAAARDEKWTAPGPIPDWVSHIRLFGDVRVRYEGDFFPGGNDNTGSFPNFNAINTGSPYDVSGTSFAPELNVDQDRTRFRIRARFGLEADLGNGFSAGLRIGTGETNSPVSGNQSLGAAYNGQGGDFSKYAIWLDRGYLKYELASDTDHSLGLSLGRFDNPFVTSSTIMWADDIGFDGLALTGRYQVAKGVTPFGAFGAFPIFNTDFNFSSNQPAKFKSDDKYLFAGQVGTDWKINKDLNFKIAGGYFYFYNVAGKLSDPFTPLTTSDQGNTDDLRPSFAQKGNSYMALRDIVPNASNNYGASLQYQYYGLATPFHVLALTSRLDYTHFEPLTISLMGDYIKNLAFNGSDIAAKAVNNRGDSSSGLGSYVGGDTGWFVGVRVGKPSFEKFGDWSTGINYRYVESDATIDGFVDSDFGGGGTNVKGFSLFGSMALSPNVAFTVRWMSSNEVSGPPLKEDVLQVDLSGKF